MGILAPTPELFRSPNLLIGTLSELPQKIRTRHSDCIIYPPPLPYGQIRLAVIPPDAYRVFCLLL